jgi:hypothetical protein
VCSEKRADAERLPRPGVRGGRPQPDSGAQWSLDADPLLNDRVTFDSQTGIVHVVGDYVMTFTYRLESGLPTSPIHSSGSYDASVMLDGTEPTVLRMQTS